MLQRSIKEERDDCEHELRSGGGREKEEHGGRRAEVATAVRAT